MKKILNIFFVSLGIIFFILILVGIYLYAADPFNVKPLIKLFTSGNASQEILIDEEDAETASSQDEDSTQQDQESTGGFTLSTEQKASLEAIGINPSSIPNEFTQEQQECFEGILGQERVDQIKSGVSPTAAEFFKARECL